MKVLRCFLHVFVFSTIVLLGSCGGKQTEVYRIGVDPTWFPLNLPGKEANVFAFSNELLQEISRLKKVSFERVNISWDNLLRGLKEGKYEGMLSSMKPYVFNLKKYDFSGLYLETGPVLIANKENHITSFQELNHKIVGVDSQANEALIMEKNQEVIIRFYDSIPTALNEVVSGKLDGVLVNLIPAIGYVEDLFQEELAIMMPPLNDEGLRLITLYDKHQDLLKVFNKGLEELKEDGTYDKLLKKWKVGL